MRPKGLIGLAVIAVLVGLTMYLISDSLIESGMEKAGEAIVGAKVEIDNLTFSLLSLSISLDRLQVTNPNNTWKNLFETARMSFNMELKPLFRKNIIINDITVADIRIGTKRTTNGRIPKKPTEAPGWVEQAKESLMQQLASAPVLNLSILKKKINVDSIFAVLDIESINQIEMIKQDADSTYQRWNQIISEFDPKKELQNIDSKIDAIKTQEIKGLDDLASTLDNANKLYKTLNVLKKDVESKKNQAKQDFKRFTNSLARVDNWIKGDFNRVKNKANLANFTPNNVGKMLFGQSMVFPTIGMLRYVSIARKYAPVAEQLVTSGQVEKPPRLKGQDIRFPLLHPVPDFLIEHILVSGATSHEDTSKVLHVSGEITGITSHPKIYGKPITFELEAQLPQLKAYRLTGSLDHTKDIAEEHFRIKGSGIQFGRIDLPERPYLPSRIDANHGDVSANLSLIGDILEVRLNFVARPVTFIFPDSLVKSDAISKVTRGVFDSIHRLQLSAGVSGPVDDLKLKINSNIDKILARRIQGVIGESVKLAQAEIHKQLNALVGPKKQEALGFTQNRQNKITLEIAKHENLINDKLAVLDKKKKEIETKIEKEKTKGIDKVTKKLKDLFKKP